MNDRTPDAGLNRSLFPMFGSDVFAWPAWLRMLAVLPACLVLWLAVCWALA